MVQMLTALCSRLYPPATISRRIRIEGRTQVSSVKGLAVILNNSQPGFGPIPIPLPAQVNADGTFQVEGVLPGEYRLNVVGFDSQSTMYLRDARFGTNNVLTEPFKISGSVSEPFEIVLATDAGQ